MFRNTEFRAGSLIIYSIIVCFCFISSVFLYFQFGYGWRQAPLPPFSCNFCKDFDKKRSPEGLPNILCN